MNRSSTVATLSPLLVNSGIAGVLALVCALAWIGVLHLQGAAGANPAP